MTERKPAGTTFESWVDKQIRAAQVRGEFDNLPSAGKPLPGLQVPDDELWWVKNYARKEGLSTEAMLPTPLQLRKEIERLPETVRELRSEQAVRDVVTDLNRRIGGWLRAPSGPQVRLGPVKVEDVVAQWRAQRPQHTVTTEQLVTAEPAPVPRSRWWRVLLRRCRAGE